jgi:hypothetical protein
MTSAQGQRRQVDVLAKFRRADLEARAVLS